MPSVVPSPTGLTCHLEERDAAVILRLQGHLTVAQMATLDRAILPIPAYRKSLVIVDLQGVDFLCSLALGTLITLKRTTESHGGRFRLSGTNPRLTAVFVNSRLDSLFQICPTVDDALAPV